MGSTADVVRLDCATDHREGITLVTCRLTNRTSEPRGVRLENRLDGPTLAPRRRGRPVPGWDGDEYTTILPATRPAAVGYACPAPPRHPPAAVVAVGAPAMVPDDATLAPPPVVPREVVLDPAADSVGPATDSAGPATDSVGPATGPANPATGPADPGSCSSADDRESSPGLPSQPRPPAAVESYFAAVEWLVGLEAATNGSLARAASVASIAAPATLDRRLRRAREQLRAVADRASRLASQCEPTATDELEEL